MGYQTTITIYNDYLHEMEEMGEKFYEELSNAISSGQCMEIGNIAKVQRTRHGRDTSLYVHKGNTVQEMNAYSPETERILKRNPEAFKELLETIKDEAKNLERMLKKKKKDCE